MKILFLLKQSDLYGDVTSPTSKSGLMNSARITAKELEDRMGVETRVRICQDANSIDREVRDYRPNLCIIEAIWVLPEKFIELGRIYKKLPFIVRVHSEVPFLSNEGEAMSRIHQYVKLCNVLVAFNSKNTFKNFCHLDSVVYLPNIYQHLHKNTISIWEEWDYIFNKNKFTPYKDVYHIGCFGAIRPLKNQLLQAFAAIEFGEKYKIRVKFHINSARVEQGGNSVLKNIRALFRHHPEHKLIEHGWLNRKDFLGLIRDMDLGLQLSFNESFNIVTADFVKERVPIIVSSAIDWMPKETQIDSELAEDIADKMASTLAHKRYIVKKSNNKLVEYNQEALKIWKAFLK